ncbi:MAG: hypothetical protein PUB04_01550, partial [Clostridia bacterium]|nr:hypothetical protein [Clostridia bacterium]
ITAIERIKKDALPKLKCEIPEDDIIDVIRGKQSNVNAEFVPFVEKGLGKTKAQAIIEKKEINETGIQLSSDTQIDEMLDAEFESFQLNMTPDEAKEHMMKLIYHMLGTAYEIKILSNARIVEHIEDETTQIEKKKEAEKLLTEKVSNNINKLLSDETLMLDVNTSKQLFGLLGGGIRISGEYVPVELEKVNAAIESMKNGIG